jgi:hypothetical protein
MPVESPSPSRTKYGTPSSTIARGAGPPRVDDDVRLLRAIEHVDPGESERLERVGDRRQTGLGRFVVEVQEQMAVVDVDRQARHAVAAFVQQPEGRGRLRVRGRPQRAVPQAPTRLARREHRVVERLAIEAVLHRERRSRTMREPSRERARRRALDVHRAAIGVRKSQRAGVKQEPRRLSLGVATGVEAIAGDRRAHRRELHARLMGAAGAQLQREQRAIAVPLDDLDVGHRLLRATIATVAGLHHALPTRSLDRPKEMPERRARGAPVAGDGGDVALLDRPALELPRQRDVRRAIARVDQEARRRLVEALVHPEAHALERDSFARGDRRPQPRDDVVVAVGRVRLRQRAGRLVDDGDRGVEVNDRPLGKRGPYPLDQRRALVAGGGGRLARRAARLLITHGCRPLLRPPPRCRSVRFARAERGESEGPSRRGSRSAGDAHSGSLQQRKPVE